MAHLALYLLGPPRLERDGAPAVTDTRKAIALLAYLVGARAPHSRDALAALFWPDYDQVRARGALRRTLSALNSALGGVGVLAGRETLALDPAAGLEVDVDAFLARLTACRAHGHPAGEVCAACLAPLAEAVAIYRDDFLAGFTLRDSPAFDEWQFFQTETLRRDLAGALERLAAGLAAAGEWEPAIAHARRRLALDPLHEPAHRQLMRLYAWAGQRGAALRQYRECVQVLDQELGVAPLEATTRLYAAIRDNALGPPLPLASAPGAPAAPAPPAPPAPAPAPLPAPAGYPLVGRAAEWDAMLAAYSALHGAGHVLAVEGEAGIGKSRLAAEFAAWATAHGATVIAARCYEGEQNLAYAPVMALLRAALPGPGPAAPAPAAALPAPWLAEAARLLPDLAAALPGLPPPPALDSPGAQGRFFEGLRQVLLAAAGPTPPGVLLLEDAQWADSASLDFLTYCVRRLDDAPALLLLTWRGAQAAPDPRLPALFAVAQAAGRATVLHLRRLSPAAVAELVRAAGPAAPPALAERLYQETEGLPFFVVEYLAALAAGAPGPPGEDWALPGGARDLLRARVSAAGETGRQLLHTAAVIGRSFDFDILREASGRGEEETVAALDALIGAGLVTEAPGGEAPGALTYDFSHQKLRALVYDETSLARRRLLHRRVAEALAGQTRGGRDPGARAGQIARHYEQAGAEGLAADYYRRAGDRARALYANREALAHYERALALGAPQPGALHEAIGDLRTLLGDYAAALSSYETAAALSEPAAQAAIEQKLGAVHGRLGEWAVAGRHFEAALDALGPDGPPAARARYYADWALSAHHRGAPAEAATLARQALTLAEAAGDKYALAQAHNMIGILASRDDDRPAARRALEQSLALADAVQEPGLQVAALHNLARLHAADGAYDRAVALAEQALALCVAQGDRHREAALHSRLADLLHLAGRSEEAMRHLKQAVTIYAAIGVEAGAVKPGIWQLAEW